MMTMTTTMQKPIPINNIAGCFGVAIILVAIGWALHYLYRKLVTQENYALPTDVRAKATPSPIVTNAPASNAPVKGEPKQIVVPKRWRETSIDNTANFTLAKKMVVRWDLIPVTARVVTFGFRMSNPPIPGEDKHNRVMHPLLASIPNSSGISVSFMDRGKYRIDAGSRFRQLTYVRDSSDFDPTEERVEIRFTQVGPGKTRVEMIYNGEDSVLAAEKDASVADIRHWPQQLKVFETDKIQNIWLSYA